MRNQQFCDVAMDSFQNKRVALINPPKTDSGRAELTPPLGLLRLATVARESGAEPVLCDLNAIWHLDPRLHTSFYETATDLLLAADARVCAFTSMCVDSHVAIELARRLKEADHRIITVFGGVHFSTIADELKCCFPWIDYVIKGEGEFAFANLLLALNGNRRSGTAIFQSGGPGLTTLPPNADGPHELPEPAYDLVDMSLYFALNPRRLVDFESGRGCRFRCSFCYSPGHYLKARDFGMAAVLKELRDIKMLGVERFALADDNFLNVPDRALAFCHTLRNERLGLHWQCYATLPQISQQLVAAMSEAGCDRVFCGVDAVGKASQRTFRKAFVSTTAALECKVRMLHEYGVVPTCAFLLCPPSHPGGSDIEATLRAALGVRLCGAQVRLNTLTLYNGTPAMSDYEQHLEYDDLRVRLLLDVPGPVETNEFAKHCPSLFPFHSRYVAEQEWRRFVLLAHCVSSMIDTYPRTLDRLWLESDVNPIDVSSRVLEAVGDITALDKESRRTEEQIIGYDVLQNLVSGSSQMHILESENPFEQVVSGSSLKLAELGRPDNMVTI